MSLPLQKTKLYLPAARAQLVERARLLDRLDEVRGEGCRMVLVSSSPGSGKTTLVVQWLSRLGLPAGWLSLDARDNLPSRFFAYLIEALRAVAPGAGSQSLALLEVPGANPEEGLTLLANELSEASAPFILVLDDFHLVTNPLLHRALDLLLEAQPPQMRLVLISREDPALQLSRRRARGQLVELRQEDLRFSLPEALDFFNQGMALRLTVEQAAALEARTEGWIAGLQMAALSLQRTADPDRFIREFSGSHRFILDYLVEEVLAHQPAEIQAFLLQTSVLERMRADLCAALTGKTALDSQKLLEQLARANLFVVPLDEERGWYRYHHLFADLLFARLKSEDPQGAARLCLSASGWAEANGDPRLAVEYALKAQDPGRAADLIERYITSRWQTVDMDFFFLVNRLPAEVVAQRPGLCLHSAWAAVIQGQVERIAPLVDAAEACLSRPGRPPQPGDPANRAFARVLRAYAADFQDQPLELDPSLEQAFAAIPEENPGMRNSVAVVIGSLYYMEGDFATAMGYFEKAAALDKRVNGTNAIPIATMRMTWVLQAQGRLRAAERLVSEQIAYVRERGARRYYISGALNLLRGEILLEWNQLSQAQAEIEAGLRLLEDWPAPQVRAQGLCLLARLRIVSGDLAGAQDCLAKAEALQDSSRLYPGAAHVFERVRVRLWAAAHNRAALEAWLAHNQFLAGREHFRYEYRQIEYCRALLALGRRAEAAGLLERLDRRAAAGGRSGSRVMILALLAAARSNQPHLVLPILEEVLRLAEPHGYLLTFLGGGEPVRQALNAWLQSRPAQENLPLQGYARRILAAFDGTPKAGPAPQLPEALSPRELEVLGLAAKGLTNQQIAARLVISIRTVKKHIENIHAKLGVQNRTQAAALARELGLLDG